MVPAGVRAFAADRLGGLPKAFWYLWGGTLVNRIGTFVEPFLVLYLTTARGLSVASAGAILALHGVGAFVSQPIGGVLTDRIGRRATMILGLVLAAMCLLALGAARGAPALGSLAVATGIVGDLYRPASTALVADLVPPEDRTRAFGLLYWAINLGFALAATAAGFLAEVGFTWLFVADAATTLAFALVIARGVPETRDQVLADATPDERGGGLLPVLRDRVLLAFTAITLVSVCIYFQAYTTLPLAMRGDGLPPSAYGMVIALNGVVIIAVQPLVIGWLGRLPRVPVLAWSFVLLGLGFGLTGVAASAPAFGATVVLWTLGEIGGATVSSALVADIVPAAVRGRALGVFGTAWGAAAVIAPAGGAALFERAGEDVLWWTCVALGLVLAGAQLVLGPAIRRRMLAVSTGTTSPSAPR